MTMSVAAQPQLRVSAQGHDMESWMKMSRTIISDYEIVLFLVRLHMNFDLQ